MCMSGATLYRYRILSLDPVDLSSNEFALHCLQPNEAVYPTAINPATVPEFIAGVLRKRDGRCFEKEGET